MKTAWRLALCLWMLMLGSLSASAGQTGYLIPLSGEQLIVVYSESNLDAEPIGLYNIGTKVQILLPAGSWCNVAIGMGEGTLEGFVPVDAIAESMGEEWAAQASPRFVAVTQPEGDASLYAAPDEASALLGTYLDGTILQVIGQQDGWMHVLFAPFGTGFMHSASLMPIDRSWIMLTGMEPIGWVEVTKSGEDPFGIRMFPHADAAFVEGDGNGYPAVKGQMYTLLQVLDGWVQVRRTTDLTMGFLSTEHLSTHLIEDVFVPKEMTLQAGTYQSGADIPSGLYTWTLEEDQAGALSVENREDMEDQTYSVYGSASYTLFLPDWVRVAFTQGTLRPTDRTMVASPGEPFTGNGRFLLGVQIPVDYAHSTMLIGADRSQPSCYLLISFDGVEIYGAGEGQRSPLAEDMTRSLTGWCGYFLEVENGRVQVDLVQ